MKTCRSFYGLAWLCPLILAWANLSQAAPAPELKPPSTRFAVGISPFLTNAAKDEVYRQLVGFLIEDAPMNSSLWFYDAYQLRTITQVDIPGVSAFRSAKTRANQFKEPIRKLRDFLADEHEKPSGPDARLNLEQAVRLPQFLDFVVEHLPGREQSLAVIVLGSPLYLDHKEPRFSMADGYFPSDGHLQAARELSVFGIKDRGETLKDIEVYLGYFGDPWVSGVHEERVARFWALYMKEQGGQLASLCGDLPTLFHAVRAGASLFQERQERYAIDPAQTKIEMLRMTRDLGVDDWITRDAVPNDHRGPPSGTAGPMKIGIRWQGAIDLDLYATPGPRAETLFFEHTRSPEGYYFKDHRSSPQREYEFIEFEKPVDVWQVEAMINFYEGRAGGGPTGEIRVEFEGRIFTGTFSLEATRGNQGRSGRAQSAHWTRIDIPSILRLRPPRNEAVF